MEEDDIPTFAARIKAKYPDYASVDDYELVEKVVRKHPVYASQVKLPEGFGLLYTSSGYGKIDSIYEEMGRKYNVDPNLLLEQGRQETSFNPDVFYGKRASSAGAVGAGQFMPGTAPKYGVTDRTDPIQSIEGQAKYMRKLLDDFDNDESLALAGYNAGEYRKALTKDRRVPNIPETQHYVKTIKEKLDEARSKSKRLRDFIQQSPSVQAPTPTTQPTTQPTPEAPSAFEAQLTVARDPKNMARSGVFFPNDGTNAALKYANGLDGNWALFPDKKHNGTHLINLAKAKKLKLRTPKEIQEFIDKNPNAFKTLGIAVEDVGNDTQGVAITAENNGVERASAVVRSPETAVEQINAYQKQFPDATIRPTTTDEIVQNRIATLGGTENVPPSTEPPMTVAGELISDPRQAEKTRISQAEQEKTQAALQARFAELRKTNPSLTVDQFNQILSDEHKVKVEKSKQEWLAKNPALAKFAKEKNLDPFAQETVNEYNTSRKKYSATKSTAKTQFDKASFNQANKFLREQGQPELSREEFIARQEGNSKVGISLDPNTFTVDGTKITDYEIEAPAQGGGTIRFPREVGKGRDANGTVAVYRSEKGMSEEDAYRAAFLNAGSRYGVTPEQVNDQIDRLKSAGKNLFQGGKHIAGNMIAVTWDDLANVGVDVNRERRMEQSQNTLVPAVDVGGPQLVTAPGGTRYAVANKDTELPTLGEFVDQILGDRDQQNNLTEQRKKELEYRVGETQEESEAAEFRANVLKSALANNFSLGESEVITGFGLTAASYLSWLGAGGADLTDKIDPFGVLSGSIVTNALFGRSRGDFLGKFGNKVQKLNELSTPDNSVYKIYREVGNVAGALPAYAAVGVAVGGNPVLTFALTDALVAKGKGGSLRDTIGAGAKGAVMGAMIGNLSRLGTMAADGLLGESLLKVVPKVKWEKSIDPSVRRAISRIWQADAIVQGGGSEAIAAKKVIERELAKSGLTLEQVLAAKPGAVTGAEATAAANEAAKKLTANTADGITTEIDRVAGREIARGIIEYGVPIGLATGIGYGVSAIEGGSTQDNLKNALLFGAMQALGSIFHKKKGEKLTPDEVNKADGTVVRVPDEKGKPHDLILLKENNELTVTDVTGKVPPEAIQGAVLPKPPTPAPTDGETLISSTEIDAKDKADATNVKMNFDVTDEVIEPPKKDIAKKFSNKPLEEVKAEGEVKYDGVDDFFVDEEKPAEKVKVNEFKVEPFKGNEDVATEPVDAPSDSVEAQQLAEYKQQQGELRKTDDSVKSFVQKNKDRSFSAPLQGELKGKSVILHPSTRGEGLWQASFLDKDGEPFRDTVFSSYKQAVDEIVRQYNADLSSANVHPSPTNDAQTNEPKSFVPQTANTTTRYDVGAQDTFKLDHKSGASVTGYFKNADMPNGPSLPTRGELFYAETPANEQRKGIATSLAKDALRLMQLNGATTVTMNGTTEAGRKLIQKLQTESWLGDPIQTSTTGKTEYPIQGGMKNTPSDSVEVGKSDAPAQLSTKEQAKALRDLGYTLPVQRTLSDVQKADIIAKGVKKQDYVATQADVEATPSNRDADVKVAEKKANATVRATKAIAVPRSAAKRYSYADEVADQINTPEFKKLESQSAREVPSRRTGFTKTQTDYLARQLTEYVHDTLTAQGFGSADGLTAQQYLAKIKDEPLPSSILVSQTDAGTIAVPDDGVIRVSNIQQAVRLHQKITGKPIEGISKDPKATIPRDNLDKWNAESRKPKFGKTSQADLDAIRKQEQAADEARAKGISAEAVQTAESADVPLTNIFKPTPDEMKLHRQNRMDGWDVSETGSGELVVTGSPRGITGDVTKTYVQNLESAETNRQREIERKAEEDRIKAIVKERNHKHPRLDGIDIALMSARDWESAIDEYVDRAFKSGRATRDSGDRLMLRRAVKGDNTLKTASPPVLKAELKDYFRQWYGKEAAPKQADNPLRSIFPNAHPDEIAAVEAAGVEVGNNFDPAEDSILRSINASVEGNAFYSRVESVITDKMPPKATPAQVTALLAKNSVKELDPEFQALKVWLDDQGNVSKEDVLAFVAANKTAVSEVVKGTKPDSVFSKQADDVWIDQYGNRIENRPTPLGSKYGQENWTLFDAKGDAINDGYTSIDAAKRGFSEDYRRDLDGVETTHFAQWQLPGESENYREEFLTAPVEKTQPLDTSSWTVKHDIYAGSRRAQVFDGEGNRIVAVIGASDAEAMQHALERATGTWQKQQNWKDGHSDYDDVTNPIARIRYNDRTTTDGDKMLFAEEIQQPNKENLAKMPKVYQKFGEQMAIRKMLYRAVEGGYDYFGFTTGQQQADRYDLSKQIKAIKWLPSEGVADTTIVRIFPNEGKAIAFTVGKDGKVTSSFQAGARQFEGKDLADVVGKDVAEKIAQSAEGRLEGLDLKVGGEGLINRYDRKHVDYINKLMKPYGVSVEAKEIATISDAESAFGGKRDIEVLRNEAQRFHNNEIDLRELNSFVSKGRDLTDNQARSMSVGQLTNYLIGNKTETIHAVRISPEFRAAVEESINSTGGAFPLFKIRSSEDVDALYNVLPYIQNTGDLLEYANGGTITDGELELSPYDAEVTRRLLAEVQKGTDIPASEGAVYNASTLNKMAKVAEAKSAEMTEMGYPKSYTDNLDNLAKNLRTIASNAKHGILYTFDESLPEERFHLEDLSAGRTSKEAIEQMKQSPLWDASEKFNRDYGKLSDRDKASEIVAKLATGQEKAYGWDKIDNFEAERAKLFDTWIDGIIAQNNITNIEAFNKEFTRLGAVYAEAKTNKDRTNKEGVNGNTGVQGGTSEGTNENRGQSEEGNGVQDRAVQGENKEKLASLPKTLRKYGLDAVDVAYTVYGDTEATADAVEMFEKNGIDGSIKLLESIKTPDASHTILEGIVYDTLLNQSLDLQGQAATDLRLKADTFLKNASERHIKAGRYTRAVQLMAHSPSVSVMQGAQSIAESVGNNLSDEQVAKFGDLARELETAFAETQMYKKQRDELKKENKKLAKKLEKVLSEKMRKRASYGRRQILARVENKFGTEIEQAAKDLRKLLAGDVLRSINDGVLRSTRPPLTEKQKAMVDALGNIGAHTLLEGMVADVPFLPETFKQILITQYGQEIESIFPEVYDKAIKTRDKWLKDIAKENQRKAVTTKLEDAKFEAEMEKALNRQLPEKLTDGDILDILGVSRDIARRQRAIEKMHRLASGVRKTSVTTEMRQMILTTADNDLQAVVAEMVAEGRRPREIYNELKDMPELFGGKFDQTKAEEAFVRGMGIVKEAKQTIKDHQDEIKQEMAAQDKMVSDIDVAELHARKRLDKAKRETRDEYERLKNPKTYYAKKAYTTGVDLLRNLTLSAELSFLMRQGGKAIRSEGITYPFRKIQELRGKATPVQAQPAGRGALRTLLPTSIMGKELGNVGERAYAANVLGVEEHPLYNEAVKFGMDFSTAGKIGHGLHVGEEQLQSEAIDMLVDWLNRDSSKGLATKMPRLTRQLDKGAKVISQYPKMIQRFDKSMAVFLDNLRMKLYERLSNELKAQGYDVKTNRNEFEELVRRINTGTSRPNRMNNFIQKGIDGIVESRIALAPSYTVAKWQDMGADVRNVSTAVVKAVAFQGLPKGTQRIMIKRAVASYGALVAQYALIAVGLGALVSFDPDDDDFLKLKIGNYRYDLTQGNRSELRYIGKLIKHYDNPDKALGSSLKYLRTRLNVLPGFALNAWVGKDVAGQDFSLKDPKRWVGLVAPLTWMNTYGAYKQDGAKGIAGTLPFDFVGYQSIVYPDRVKDLQKQIKEAKAAGKPSADIQWLENELKKQQVVENAEKQAKKEKAAAKKRAEMQKK